MEFRLKYGETYAFNRCFLHEFEPTDLKVSVSKSTFLPKTDYLIKLVKNCAIKYLKNCYASCIIFYILPGLLINIFFVNFQKNLVILIFT